MPTFFQHAFTGLQNGIGKRAVVHLVTAVLTIGSVSCGSTSPREYARFTSPKAHDIRCLAFSPDGKYLAVGVAGTGTFKQADTYWKGRLELYDVVAKTLVAQHEVEQWINSISFSPTENLLVVGIGATQPRDPHGYDRPRSTGTMILYSIPDLKEKGRFTSNIIDCEVTTAAFHPKGNQIYGLVRSVKEKRAEVRQWSSPSLKEGFVIDQKEGQQFSSMALSADHANLLLSDWVWPTPTTPGYGVLHLFDCKTGERTLTLETTAREPFTHIAVSAKDSIVVGAAEGATQVLDLSKKAVVDNPLAFGASGFRSCAFSEDGTWFARIEYLTGSGQWTEFALMNRKSEKTIKWEERNCRFQQVAFSRDGKLLAAVGFSVKDAVRSPVVVLWHTP